MHTPPRTEHTTPNHAHETRTLTLTRPRPALASEQEKEKEKTKALGVSAFGGMSALKKATALAKAAPPPVSPLKAFTNKIEDLAKAVATWFAKPPKSKLRKAIKVLITDQPMFGECNTIGCNWGCVSAPPALALLAPVRPLAQLHPKELRSTQTRPPGSPPAPSSSRQLLRLPHVHLLP